ncbi:RecQ family ATP-dependent DNA helicase [Mangrovibacterium diazotrophicum]|uniref:ATP-dependent DNA helicase RecQ n=1 Tax=Mangrovibacterium diazotrophicum TaxID=1261403 RepID=A0A419W3W9_9BACT|nr:ATP-dependent DNA helicase RecQ [Mangrovibacterium diazotrophicum]RKD90144.1 ATP-dependent DNA helicase RecQ [Mangrovibacterium diazotrophicum]
MSIYRSILQKHWGYPNFRPLQEEIIESVAAGKDTLGLMPTGGGKSVTFQVYSLSKPGICLVVTPLISLMKDQVENLQKKGIRALAIHSGMSQQEVKLAFDSAAWGDYKFLYLSPERVGTERFKERLQQMEVNLIAVDEAHCISQWGYDFRPSYRRIKELRDLLPKVPILALTATATPVVVKDIQQQLQFKKENVLQKSFFRDNLTYLVREREDKMQYLLQSVQRAKGTGIVYVRSRKLTREISDYLRQNKVSADYYHAGLSGVSRAQKQEDWKSGKTRVIVATNAFGMGIDKSDVRFVIHMGPPDSPEAYFQEAGRAGRDEKRAFAVLIAAKSDERSLKGQVEKSFPPVDVIRRVYQALCNYFQLAIGYGKDQILAFKIGDFASRYNMQIQTVLACLKILQREGYLELTEELDNPSRVHFTVGRDELYRFQVANANFDGFLKLLLRSYSALFTNYVNIDEDMLAKRANITTEAVGRFLTMLSSHRVIHYIPRKKTPYVIFNKERIEPERLKISKENYTDRKDDYQRRIDAMLNYSFGRLKCRSQILLEYFGEESSVRCGKCDVCMEQNQLGLSQLELDRIGDQLKELLEEPCLFEELIFKIDKNEDELISVIRWMIDNGKIVHRIDNKLEWVKTE